MYKYKIILTLIVVISTIFLSSCNWFDDGKPCTPLTVKISDGDPNCPSGGTYCGRCEGQMCVDHQWPKSNYYCKTVYVTGGTCKCNCQ